MTAAGVQYCTCTQGDLYELLTVDGHQSWSVPSPRLRVVS